MFLLKALLLRLPFSYGVVSARNVRRNLACDPLRWLFHRLRRRNLASSAQAKPSSSRAIAVVISGKLLPALASRR